MWGLAIWGIAALAVVGCALFQPTAASESTYTGELLACTAAAKAHHPTDNVAGRAESKACECTVKTKWGIACS